MFNFTIKDLIGDALKFEIINHKKPVIELGCETIKELGLNIVYTNDSFYGYQIKNGNFRYGYKFV